MGRPVRRRLGARSAIEIRRSGTARREIAALRREVEALRAAAMTDPLTGLLNRRGFEERVGAELARRERERYPLSLIAIDVDRLKMINDTYGHVAGDDALRAIAACLRANLRPSDICGREGGDEFLIALPHASPAEAARIVARVREQLCRAGLEFHLSFSAGVVGAGEGDAALETLLLRVDRDLYVEKTRAAGRPTPLARLGSQAASARATAERLRLEAHRLIEEARRLQATKADE